MKEKGLINNVVMPTTRITARVSVVSSELSVRTRAAISQTTGSKLKIKENKIQKSITTKICMPRRFIIRVSFLYIIIQISR